MDIRDSVTKTVGAPKYYTLIDASVILPLSAQRMALTNASLSRRLEARKPTDFEKNFSTLDFEVRQLALQLQLEKKALEETEKLTVEKESEIKQIQDKISNKDMEIRRLHKQFRQNKDTCEGLKKTTSIFQEQVAGMERVLAEEKQKTKTKRSELEGHVTKYEQLWAKYQQKYESSRLAQDVMKSKNLAQQCREEVDVLNLEYDELNTKLKAIKSELSTNQWVITIAEIRCETEDIVSELQTTHQRISQKRSELQTKQQAETQTQTQNQNDTIAEGGITTEPQNGITKKHSLNTTQLNASSQANSPNSDRAAQIPSAQPSRKSLTSFQIFIPQLQSPRVAVNKEYGSGTTATPSPASQITMPSVTPPALYQLPMPVIRDNHSQTTVSPFVCIQQDDLGLEQTESSVVREIVTENVNEGSNQQSCHPDGELPDCRTSLETPQQPTPMDTEDTDSTLFKRPLEPMRQFSTDSPVGFSYENRPMFTATGPNTIPTHDQAEEGGQDSIAPVVTQEIERPRSSLWMTPNINPSPQSEPGFFSFSTPNDSHTQIQHPSNTNAINFSSHSFLSQDSTFNLGSLFGSNSPMSQPDTASQGQGFSLNMMGGDSGTRSGLSSLF